MDSKKPDKDEARSRSAADRVDALTAKRSDDPTPEPGQASQRLQEQRKAEAEAKAGGSGSARAGDQAKTKAKPVLTERQRIEARRKRRQTRRRRPVKGNPLSSGIRATGYEAKRTALFLGRGVLSAIDSLKPVLEVIADRLKWLARQLGASFAALIVFLSKALAAIGRGLLALDRVVTARRAFTAVALFAAAALIASQFIDFRAIEIGQSDYVPVQEITGAPRTEVKTPIDTHSFALVLAGIVAFAAAALSAVSTRRVLAGVLALAGGLTVIVALAVDMPAGLDADQTQLAYAGAKAVLLSGFWLELTAGAVLLISGVALAFQPAAPKPAKSAPPRRQRSAPTTVAGSRA
jgi:hypothetical protein